jgi:hypothetical protein
MTKLLRLSWLVALAMGLTGIAAAATDATPHEIFEAAQAGHLSQAQQMINQVLQDHPQYAKAHFIAAVLDARIGDLDAARVQLATARQLDPSQSFTDPPSLNALQRQLTGMRAVLPRMAVPGFTPPVHRSSVPWGLIIVLVIGAFVLLNIFRRRTQSYGQGYGPGLLPPANPGLQNGYGYGPSYPPGGSGLMGNLASGLAIGAGVAAGEELVRHVIDGNNAGNVLPSDQRDPGQNQDLGGQDFGTQDGSSWGNDSSGGDSAGWGGDSGGGGGDWS